MSTKLRVVLAQINLTVGDIEGNLQKHLSAMKIARDELSADMIVFPELGITGYPPEDLLLRKSFIQSAHQAIQTYIKASEGIYSLISYPHLNDEGRLNNSSIITYNGETLGHYSKQHLPNYSVFDEDRYFVPGNCSSVTTIKGIPIGVVICEDLWFEEPTKAAVDEGAKLILTPNASPFETDKHDRRLKMAANRAKENNVPIAFVNHVGGQDELVFDGGSFVVNREGEICQFAGLFEEKLLPVDFEFNNEEVSVDSSPFQLPHTHEKIYNALVLAVRDYITKNNFPGALIGVSGGIDSALTLAIACDAIGPDRVRAIIMPSRYSSEMSVQDAVLVATNLKAQYDIVSIESAYQAFLDELKPIFDDKTVNITEQNIQARARSVILMAISNNTGYLVLTTGNRSEMAVGYCTLYGDMAGGFAVIKDVPKTMIYELSRYRNTIHPVIPTRTIDRAPTAELAPDQKDEDTLPPYTLLDKILEAFLNRGLSGKEIIELGFDSETVNYVIKLVKQNEYKRRQAAIGPRINEKSFGRDWRYPVTNGFKQL